MTNTDPFEIAGKPREVLERRLAITRDWRLRFRMAAQQLREKPVPLREDIHPRLHQASIESAESMAESLAEEERALRKALGMSEELDQ